MIVNSNHCCVCLKEAEFRKVLSLKIDEKDQDILPFPALGVPICLLCQPNVKDLDPIFVWTNLVTLMESGLCQVLEVEEGRHDN